MSKFNPPPVEPPTEPRPTSAELKAAMGSMTEGLIRTAPTVMGPIPAARTPSEPSVMLSFKASRPLAKLLTDLAQQEGGLRKMIARVFSEAGYPVPQRDLNPQKPRRSFD